MRNPRALSLMTTPQLQILASRKAMRSLKRSWAMAMQSAMAHGHHKQITSHQDRLRNPLSSVVSFQKIFVGPAPEMIKRHTNCRSDADMEPALVMKPIRDPVSHEHRFANE